MQFTAKMIDRSTGLLGQCLGSELLWPIVQSIVSLKMSLRCQLVKCMLTIYVNTLENCKYLLHIFPTKTNSIFVIFKF